MLKVHELPMATFGQLLGLPPTSLEHGRGAEPALPPRAQPAPEPEPPRNRDAPSVSGSRLVPAAAPVDAHAIAIETEPIVGHPPAAVDAPSAVQEYLSTARASAAICCTGAKAQLVMERIRYSMWSKFATAGAAVIMMLQGVMVCLMERAEEAGLAEDKYARFRGSEAAKGDITAVDVIGAIITAAFGLGLYLFERNKEGGSLIVRFVILLVLIATEVMIYVMVDGHPVCLAGVALCLAAVLTGAGMYNGETDSKWPLPRKGYEAWNGDTPKAGGCAYLRASLGTPAAWCREFFYQLKEEDRLGRTFFVVLYIAISVGLFLEALKRWDESVEAMPEEARISSWGPLAKAFGQLLNFNCMLVLLPVLWHVLKFVHWFKCCHFRLAKFIPPGENVNFHVFVAYAVALAATGHTMSHYINYASKPEQMQALFDGKLDRAWFTGIVIVCCMLLMFAAAQQPTRRESFKTFWLSHHLFVVFWGCKCGA